MDTQQQGKGGGSESQSTVLFRFVELFEQFTDAMKKLQGAHARNLEHYWQEYFGSDSPSFTREIDTVSLAALQCQLKMLTLLMETRLAELVPERATDPFAATDEADRYRAEAEAKLINLYSRIRALAEKLQVPVKTATSGEATTPVTEKAPVPQPEPQPLPPSAQAHIPSDDPAVQSSDALITDEQSDALEEDLDTADEIEPPHTERIFERKPDNEPLQEPERQLDETVTDPDMETVAADILDENDEENLSAETDLQPDSKPATDILEDEEVKPDFDDTLQSGFDAADDNGQPEAQEPEISRPLNIDWEKASSQTPFESSSFDDIEDLEPPLPDEAESGEDDLVTEEDSSLLQNAHAVLEDYGLDDEAEDDPADSSKHAEEQQSDDTVHEEDLNPLEESVNRLKRVHRDEADIRLKTNRGDWTLSLPYFAAGDGGGKALLDVENFISVHNLAFRGVLDLANKTEHPDSEPKINRLVKKLNSYFIRLYENIHEVIGPPGSRVMPNCGPDVESDTLLQLETELSLSDWETVNEVREFKALFDEQIARPFVFFMENRDNRKAYLESIASLAQTV